MMPDKLTNIEIIPTLNRNEGYTFDSLSQKTEQAIENNGINENNFESIIYCYKNLSEKRPLPKRVDKTTVATLLQLFDSKKKAGIDSDGYYDAVAMSLALGVNAGSDEPDTVGRVAELMDYYATYGDLMTNCVSRSIPILNQVLKCMTINRLGDTLAIETILPIYENIKTTIDISDEEFLTQLDRWSKNAIEAITNENIRTIIPSGAFYKKTATITNTLTIHINKTAIEALSIVTIDDLYSQRTNYATDYWHVMIQALINSTIMKSLPKNINEFGKRILADIASGVQSLPLNEYLNAIVDQLDKRKTTSTVTDIRNLFYNGNANITSATFKFLESWLRAQGNMNINAGEAVDKILKPIINDSSCLDLILKNSTYYVTLINKAEDASYEFKQRLLESIKGTTDTITTEFARQIGLKLEPEDSK